MKIHPALGKSLLMAASVGMIVPVLAQPAGANVVVEEEAEIVLPGSVVPRKNGGYLSLTLEGNFFKLSFYDEKKKPATADAVRATTRWEPVNKSGEERSVLNPAGDGSLRGNVVVRPPFVFKVYLTLIGEDGKAIESHVIDFRG